MDWKGGGDGPAGWVAGYCGGVFFAVGGGAEIVRRKMGVQDEKIRERIRQGDIF
jgi:hypothetical protein